MVATIHATDVIIPATILADVIDATLAATLLSTVQAAAIEQSLQTIQTFR